MTESARERVDHNFVVQQGLEPPPSGEACEALSSALMFQPRVVGVLVLTALVLQNARLFLGISALLWWSALLPALNPFDALYRLTLGRRPGSPPLPQAPAPRRFSQGMAGTFAGAIGILLSSRMFVPAHILEAFLVLALAALLLGRLCLGSFLYHLFAGHRTFAVRTLPWSRVRADR